MVWRLIPPQTIIPLREGRGESRAPARLGIAAQRGGGYDTGTSRTGLWPDFRAPELTAVQPLPVGL